METIYIDFTQDILRQLELMEKKLLLDYNDGFITKTKFNQFKDDFQHITENNELFITQNPMQSGGKPKNEMEPLLLIKKSKISKPRTVKKKPLVPKNRKPKTLKEKPIVDKPKTMKKKSIVTKVRKPRTVKKKLFVDKKSRSKTNVKKQSPIYNDDDNDDIDIVIDIDNKNTNTINDVHINLDNVSLKKGLYIGPFSSQILTRNVTLKEELYRGPFSSKILTRNVALKEGLYAVPPLVLSNEIPLRHETNISLNPDPLSSKIPETDVSLKKGFYPGPFTSETKRRFYPGPVSSKIPETDVPLKEVLYPDSFLPETDVPLKEVLYAVPLLNEIPETNVSSVKEEFYKSHSKEIISSNVSSVKEEEFYTPHSKEIPSSNVSSVKEKEFYTPHSKEIPSSNVSSVKEEEFYTRPHSNGTSEKSSEKIVFLSYDDDPYTYNKSIVEYVNTPHTSNVILHMGSFQLSEAEKPKKKISKVMFRRIILLFFAAILATAVYAKPDIRNSIYEYVGNIDYLFLVFCNVTRRMGVLFPSNFKEFAMLLLHIDNLSDSVSLGTILSFLTASAYIIRPMLGNSVGLFKVVKGTFIVTNKMRKLSIQAFDSFIDKAYDILIETYDRV